MTQQTKSGYAHDPTRWRARGYVLFGGAVIIGLFGGMGYWSVTAELEGAIISQGELRVETKSKPVQHQEGGTVGKIFVKDGDIVKAGQSLIQLDETTQQASLTIVDGQLMEFLARKARLLTVRDEETRVEFPAEVLDRAREDDELEEVVRGQRNLFASRMESYRQQQAQLRERIAQLLNEIRGGRARSASLRSQFGSLDEEAKEQQDLLERGLVTKTRLQSLRRERTRIEGDIGALDADEARLKRQIQETQIEMTQLREARREEAIAELRDTETRIAELRQRMIVARDSMKRIDVTSPVDGVVQGMNVFASGAVVGPGEDLMTIVPVSDRLILEARVQSNNRDKIEVGRATRVRFTTFNQRTTPELNGSVSSISADRDIDEQTGASFYTVQILLTNEERERLGEENVLVPGMPADIYIQTDARTPLNYLLKPITDNFEGAFKD